MNTVTEEIYELCRRNCSKHIVAKVTAPYGRTDYVYDAYKEDGTLFFMTLSEMSEGKCICTKTSCELIDEETDVDYMDRYVGMSPEDFIILQEALIAECYIIKVKNHLKNKWRLLDDKHLYIN